MSTDIKREAVEELQLLVQDMEKRSYHLSEQSRTARDWISDAQYIAERTAIDRILARLNPILADLTKLLEKQ